MYFLYLKSNGEIIVPIRQSEPGRQTLNKERECGIGSGVKWENVDLFYSPDDEFPADFARTAPLGKYCVDGNEIKENIDWEEPEEREWP